MDSVRSYFGFGKVVLPAMGHLVCSWCLDFVKGHHETGNATLQPLPAINGNEKRQVINVGLSNEVAKPTDVNGLPLF